MKIFILLAAGLGLVAGDGTGGHHHHHHHNHAEGHHDDNHQHHAHGQDHQVHPPHQAHPHVHHPSKPAAAAALVPGPPRFVRQPVPVLQQGVSRLQSLIKNRPLVRLPLGLRNRRFQLPLPLQARRRATKTNSRLNARRRPAGVKPRKPVPKIAVTPAEKIRGYEKFQLHEVIRRREGTQIFKEKPDVIHYVAGPEAGQDNLIEKIDVRTPNVEIPAVEQ